jgi:hypothetical protein
MKVDKLNPATSQWEPFTLSKAKFVPNSAGCYALTNFEETVLYVGLATDLRRRFMQHLEKPEKTGVSAEGRATKFYWVETIDINRVERTWLNIHVHNEGRFPILNKVYSPS